MRVFVAGATGVIGRVLVPRLVEAGHDVTGMTRSPAKANQVAMAGARPVVCDAFDADGLRDAVVACKPDVVVHQLTSIPKALNAATMDQQMAENDRLRAVGTANLVHAAVAAGARIMVAQSIAFAYAPEGPAVKREEDRLYVDAPEPWGRSVRAVQTLEGAVLGASELQGIVLRYGFLYGPGTTYARDGQFAAGVLTGRMRVVGNGDGLFSFVHVNDAVGATMAALAGAPPGIYNVVDDAPAPVREWLPAYAAMLGAPVPARISVEEALERYGWLTVYRMTVQRGATNGKARDLLGWRPGYSTWREGFAAELGVTA